MLAGELRGFKATPISGKTMSHTLFHDEDHELIAAFRLSRFKDYELTGEKGAASVGH
jgi:sarcosine oxidase, subunit beta